MSMKDKRGAKMDHIICKTCGKVISEDKFEIDFPVNVGTDSEYDQCEVCHDASVESGEIIQCQSCGEWFTPNKLHDERITDKHTFTPCPYCGDDFFEGYSRDELTEGLVESGELRLEKFAVIATLQNGTNRGYMISAVDANDMMLKFMKMADIKYITSISYSMILCEEDVVFS